MMSPSRFKAFALMAIVFLLGAIVGASLGTTIVSRKFAAPHEVAGRPGKAKFVDRLNARLHLSSQQTVQLKAILDRRTPYYAQADLVIDTTHKSPEAIVDAIVHAFTDQSVAGRQRTPPPLAGR